jgi:hypothetical protein
MATKSVDQLELTALRAQVKNLTEELDAIADGHAEEITKLETRASELEDLIYRAQEQAQRIREAQTFPSIDPQEALAILLDLLGPIGELP